MSTMNVGPVRVAKDVSGLSTNAKHTWKSVRNAQEVLSVGILTPLAAGLIFGPVVGVLTFVLLLASSVYSAGRRLL